MGILFTATGFVWFLSEIILNRLLRSKSSDKKGADRGTLRLIWVTILIVIPLSVFLSRATHLQISGSQSATWMGIILIYAGIILRLWVVRSLGIYFTVDVTIRQGHALKTDGFYKYLRHPSYFASLLSFAGFGIALNNWLAMTIVITAISTVFIIRIRIEEEVLIMEFGEAYLRYRQRTTAFIPFIY